MAGNTMDALKKKMAAMRFEKEAASEKAERLEQQLLRQKSLNEQVRGFIYPCTSFVLFCLWGADLLSHRLHLVSFCASSLSCG